MALLRSSQNQLELFMETVEEIQHAIQSLSEDDFDRLRKWIAESEADWDDWDRQMAEDIETGRFDVFAEQVAEARRQGKLYPLPGFERP